MSAKKWFGPPPPAELSSAELLSQGAEARIWLLNLTQQQLANTADGCGCSDGMNSHTDKSDTNNDEKTMASSTRTHHVGGGLHVPHIMHISQLQSQPQSSLSSTSAPHHQQQQQPPSPSPIIVKERFSKKYRHPSLDISLTKNRTKGEARSLIRCLKAGVACPNVLGVAHWPSSSSSSINNNTDTNTASTSISSSSCLFLEWIQGCTVRQYLEYLSSTTSGVNAGGSSGMPNPKRPRCNSDANEKDESNSVTYQTPQNGQDRITTPIDSQTLCVARNLGQLVGKMHAAGIIHGDLTTSNIMLRNPPWASSSGDSGNKPMDGDEGDNRDDGISMQDWTPQLVLIDFGLASSTTSTNTNAPNKNNNNNNKQQHNAEEKAVDLYVLERAFLSSHPESERLMEELMDGYREYFVSLDGRTITSDGDDPFDETVVDATSATTSEGTHGHAAKMILNRLDQVRMRGRKRECFG